MPSRLHKAAKKLAGELQDSVREAEEHKREIGIDYDAAHVRQSVVHTREDVIMIISLLGSVLRILISIRSYLIVVFLALVALAVIIAVK